MNLVYLSLYMLHQSQERLYFLLQEDPCSMRRVMERDGEMPKKVVESSNNCFLCSSIPASKNKVYIFGKMSTDLAGIIRSSLEFNVKKYHKDSSLFVCRQCFQQLTKYGRAVKKLREIKRELLTAFRNREQLRVKRVAHDENSNDQQWRCASECYEKSSVLYGKLHVFILILPLVLLILHVHC